MSRQSPAVGMLTSSVLVAASLLAVASAAAFQDLEERKSDPCVAIAGQKWVAPSAVRACFNSFPVNATIKTNVSNFGSSL